MPSRRHIRTRRCTGVFSTYQINVPQLNVNVDRVKVKRQNVKLSDVFQTLQVYLGSLYVNDFNRFGRTYQVVAQADAPFRSHVEDILPLKTRNASGDMVPLGSLLTVSETFGPDVVQRYNGYRARDINGGAAPGFSSGQAQAAMARILDGDAAARHDLRVDGPRLSAARSRAARRCSCFRCACCSCSWCWRRSTRA